MPTLSRPMSLRGCSASWLFQGAASRARATSQRRQSKPLLDANNSRVQEVTGRLLQVPPSQRRRRPTRPRDHFGNNPPRAVNFLDSIPSRTGKAGPGRSRAHAAWLADSVERVAGAPRR
jgi:hypothetical protein